ncbi:hypothetical protein L6R52_20920 [Myxococcota bacterium]|nr:hypothetical protein [Myxococcota bacterium]
MGRTTGVIARGIWALGVVSALAGCPRDEAPIAECRLNSDCPAPELCYGGQCVSECREDRDCGPSEVCSGGACMPEEPVQRICSTGLDCRLDEACRGGVCVPISIIARDAGIVATDASVTPSPDAGVVEPDAGASALPYGAVCSRASECASTFCLGPAGATTGRCTKSCTADTECFYPDRCVDVPGAGRFCGQTTTGKAVGDTCPGGPTECASGLCLGAGASAICTQQCAPLPICPVGLACAPVADGAGGAVTVCAPGTGRGFGDLCARGSDCASQLCLGVGSASSGVCTSFCDQVPCPIGWACSNVSDGAGGQVAICAPGGASGGGFGAACASAAECSSGLCLSDARTGSAFCTRLCTSAQDCAGVGGLTCVGLASGEQVCAPP